MNPRLVQAANRLENWLKNESLPLWAKVGIDEKTGAQSKSWMVRTGYMADKCNHLKLYHSFIYW